MFVDNAGPDVVLGMLPFARELLKQGTKVGELLKQGTKVSELLVQALTACFSCPGGKYVTSPHQSTTQVIIAFGIPVLSAVVRQY